MLFALTACSGKGSHAAVIDTAANPIYPSATDLSAHYCVTDNLKEIAASGLITLLFDENSSSIGVRLTANENSKLWSALPQAVNGETDSDEADIVALEVIHNDSLYHLNSQDNSVSVGTASWENIENGYKITYLITDDHKCIDNIGAGAADEVYSAGAGDTILYKVEVSYTLKDGCLYAELNWKNLGNDKDILANIGFLEYFGAGSTQQVGDFILVPDGSGAIVDLTSAGELEPLSIAVYGSDIGQSESTASAVIPAFGMKSGNDAFVAIIEQGDALAEITANKAKSGSNYNRVGANFAVTPSQIDGDKEYFSEIGYSGAISLCFRFLSGSDASYAGLAAACREQLVRNFTLSNGSVQETEHMPILVNVIGSAKESGFLSFSKNLTTFDEAVDLLTRIKSKGINNVYLRYSGALSGGMNPENASDAKILSSLGGKSGLQKLNDYAAGLNFSVFMDVSLLTSASSKGAVGDLVNSKTEYTGETVLDLIAESPIDTQRYISKLSSLERTVLAVLERFNEFEATGFCVEDAGKMLYTDYTAGIDRESAKAILSENISPLATQNLVMVENGNFYALKNADIVSNLPMTCHSAQGEAYTAVPFVQIVLHGIVEFSSEPINFSDSSKERFLRCIEFGAIPTFVLADENCFEAQAFSNSLNADNWLGEMYSCYNRSSEALGDLRSSRITDHYEVSPGVYCTEYESTTRIYVNYTDESVTVSGITVEPMNYFRVN